MTKRMLALGLLVLAPSALLAHCGGTSGDDDAGLDSGTTDAAKDSGKDATTQDAGKDAKADGASDATTDTTTDATTDASDDATDATADVVLDAPADVTPNDGGTISAITGLVLWLDAAKGVTKNGNNISAWADQSGQANNAAGGTSTPTLVSSSINALPAAHFVATSAQFVTIADATSLQFGTGDYYLAVVAKFDNDPTQGVVTGLGSLYTKTGQSSGLLFFANILDIQNTTVSAGLDNLEDPNTSVSYASAYNDGAARLYAVQRASGTETLRVNASQVASSSSSVNVSETGVAVFIGVLGGQTAGALDGDIAEIIEVKGTLSSTDRANIEGYLQFKYGL